MAARRCAKRQALSTKLAERYMAPRRTEQRSKQRRKTVRPHCSRFVDIRARKMLPIQNGKPRCITHTRIFLAYLHKGFLRGISKIRASPTTVAAGWTEYSTVAAQGSTPCWKPRVSNCTAQGPRLRTAVEGSAQTREDGQARESGFCQRMPQGESRKLGLYSARFLLAMTASRSLVTPGAQRDGIRLYTCHAARWSARRCLSAS